MAEEGKTGDSGESTEELKAKVKKLESDLGTVQHQHDIKAGALEDKTRELKKFDGIDPDKHFMYKTNSDKYLNSKKDPDSQSDDDIREQIRKEEKEKLKEEWDELEGRCEKLTNDVTSMKLVDATMAEIGADFNEDMHPVIREQIQKYGELKDGKRIFKNESGEPYFVKPGEPGDSKYFAEILKTKFPSAVKGQQFRGNKTDTQKYTGNTSDISVERFRKMTKEEREKIDPKKRAELSKESLRQRNL